MGLNWLNQKVTGLELVVNLIILRSTGGRDLRPGVTSLV